MPSFTNLHKTMLISLTLILSLLSNSVYADVEDGMYNPPQFKDLRDNPRMGSMDCLVAAMYHESRGESKFASVMVVVVVMNRVTDSARFPNGICSVIFAKNAFSFIGDKHSDEFKDLAQYKRLYKLAEYIMENRDVILPLMGDTDHYHEVKVKPYWSKAEGFKKISRIDNHVFYSSDW